MRFSTENWNRPDTEVEALMKLLATYFKNCIKRADKNNMRIRVSGIISRLDTKFQNNVRELREATKKNTGLNLQIALNYGSRDEMIRAMKKMVKDHDARQIRDRGHYRRMFFFLSGYERDSGPGSADPYQWRAASVELPALAACIQ